jgi:DNA-binding NtrC family response regulator
MLQENQFKSILLIDDDEDDCLFFKQAMTHLSSDITLICKQSADSLFETIAINKPSLIFIDMHLPKNNGIDCLRKIKTHPQFKNIPVVIWSTSSINSYVIAAYKEGAQYYFQKPCYFFELVDTFKRILKQNNLYFDLVPSSEAGIEKCWW